MAPSPAADATPSAQLIRAAIISAGAGAAVGRPAAGDGRKIGVTQRRLRDTTSPD
jgi:hypothetical protein